MNSLASATRLSWCWKTLSGWEQGGFSALKVDIGVKRFFWETFNGWKQGSSSALVGIGVKKFCVLDPPPPWLVPGLLCLKGGHWARICGGR